MSRATPSTSLRASEIVEWLDHVQVETGELPYSLSPDGDSDRVHFLCHQYNAFEFMDLAHYHRLTGDDAVLSLMARLAEFLATGFTATGHARYDCRNESTEVPYYTASLCRALSQATSLGLGDHRDLVRRGLSRLIAQQRADGSFPFSRRDYGVLRDSRSYPRAQSMILYHLLEEAGHQRRSVEIPS